MTGINISAPVYPIQAASAMNVTTLKFAILAVIT